MKITFKVYPAKLSFRNTGKKKALAKAESSVKDFLKYILQEEGKDIEWSCDILEGMVTKTLESMWVYLNLKIYIHKSLIIILIYE